MLKVLLIQRKLLPPGAEKTKEKLNNILKGDYRWSVYQPLLLRKV